MIGLNKTNISLLIYTSVGFLKEVLFNKICGPFCKNDAT